LYLWVRLLIPGVVKRVYNMQSKQMIKIFSRIFHCVEDEMLEDLEKGDVSETVATFFSRSSKLCPKETPTLMLHQVDEFLDHLSQQTREEEQQRILEKVVKRSTIDDLRMFVRLIKGDLKIQAGVKHVLDALHPDAHDAFNSSRNIDKVLDKVIELQNIGDTTGKLEIGATLMQPVQPMLAAPCKSVDMAFKKCPNGIYSEIKYDGERVQVHKSGLEFKYFSRSLKPVMAHKVKHFKDFIPNAFPKAENLIIDAEVLLVDNKTGLPLPFGTLGVHKGSDFKDADPCLFVFDCIFYNGENLMNRPLKNRREFLVNNMIEVGNRIKLSEIKKITSKEELLSMIKDVFQQGLEGLMVKDLKSVYEPGKRHWLKIKKDYLNEGAMADSADLVVLGGWFGTGQKGGLISIFLMGCRDTVTNKWCTVSKVHTGHDDATLEKLQEELAPKMRKIKGDYNQVPAWMNVNRNMVPDFVVRDPKESPVWEITGAEFSKADLHTAFGISIRFPRVTRIREDKTYDTATNLQELKELYQASKQFINLDTGEVPSASISQKEKESNKRKLSESDNSPKKRPKVSRMTEDTNGGAFTISMKTGDLFSCPFSSSLAHCISRDCKLGKGIAKLFREKFNRIEEIRDCKANVGEVAVLKDRSRYIYNLVTKEKYHGKPTYESLRRSLQCMKEHAVKNGVLDICMPKIGCGLDGLDWSAVRTLIKNVFKDTEMRITCYTLGDEHNAATSIHQGSKQTSLKEFYVSKEPKTEGNNEPNEKDTPTKTKKMEQKYPVGFGYETSNPLVDVFVGLNLSISRSCPNYEALKRNTIAFGGKIATATDTASHLVYNTGDRLQDRKDVKHVVYKWLEDSIKLQKKQPENYYKHKE